MVVFTYVPANTRLSDYVRQLIERSTIKVRGKVVAVRAEDIPLILLREHLSELRLFPGFVYGITGSDLWENWRLEIARNAPSACDYKIYETETIPWTCEGATFGRPALCLLSKSEDIVSPRTRFGVLEIAVDKKYEALARRVLWERWPNLDFRLLPFSGRLEELVKQDLFSACIDIVSTGNTARNAGLRVVGEPLRYVNVVVLRTQAYAPPDYIGEH